MANSQLYDKTYSVPPQVIKYIQTVLVSHPTGEGVKRANFIVKNGAITYQAMKRLKNFFDYFNPQSDDKMQYALAGGDQMKAFIEKTLAADRAGVQMSKTIKQDMTTNPNSELKPYQTPRLAESTKKKELDIENYDKLKKNAVAVIVDNDDKFLLLKRADFPKMWQPNKWALVGGQIEKGEEPEEGCKREIEEETGLKITKFVEKAVVQRNQGSVEHLFACRFTGEPTDIKLNDENTNYGWYDASEIEFLDTVPNLMDYINLVFIKYD